MLQTCKIFIRTVLFLLKCTLQKRGGGAEVHMPIPFITSVSRFRCGPTQDAQQGHLLFALLFTLLIPEVFKGPQKCQLFCLLRVFLQAGKMEKIEPYRYQKGARNSCLPT